MDSLKIKLSKVEPVTMNIPTLDKTNYRLAVNYFHRLNSGFHEFEVAIDRIDWRVKAMTELEDAGLATTERYKNIKEELEYLFAWINGLQDKAYKDYLAKHVAKLDSKD